MDRRRPHDPYLTLGGRWDNGKLAIPGGALVPGASPPQALNSASSPVQAAAELVSWSGTDRGRAPRGRGIRVWATPPPVYDLTSAAAVGNGNLLSVELLATVTGFGGANTSRRFVVNTGQETVIEVGAWEAGKIQIVAATVAFNIAATLADPQNQGFANFAWIDSEDPLTSGVHERLMTRLFQTAIEPVLPTQIVVPPGATGWKPFGTVHVAPGDFPWPTAGTPADAARPSGSIPLGTFPVLPPGEVFPINGAKYLFVLAPVGFPFTFIEHQFELAPL